MRASTLRPGPFQDHLPRPLDRLRPRDLVFGSRRCIGPGIVVFRHRAG
jgi:hypothetical protein